MADQKTPFLLKTKLHRPPVADDVIARAALFDRLEEGCKLPLTLVSAPAGYGKTTLVSQWLESSGHRHCWLSLERGDSELRIFLAYLVASVRSLFSEALGEFESLLASDPLPDVQILANALVNALQELEESFVMVLDDFHDLTSIDLVGILDFLLEHPPEGLHLVIIARRDPSLQLHRLRGRRMMSEFRAGDLKLDKTDASEFLQSVSGRSIQDYSINQVYRGTEGWPVGLRLAALAIRYASSDEVYDVFDGDSLAIQEYLVREILGGLPDSLRARLERTSIFNRFCQPLCDAVLTSMPGDESETQGFVQELQSSGLLLIPLDKRNHWFRLHNLFRDLLHERVNQKLSVAELRDLHHRAAHWFEQNGLYEEAVQHLLKAGSDDTAADMIKRNRRDLVENEQWLRLSSLLGLMPERHIQEDPVLLLLAAWVANSRSHNEGMFSAIERAVRIEESLPEAEKPDRNWYAEVRMFLSWRDYYNGKVEESVAKLEQAGRQFDENDAWMQCYRIFLQGFYLQAAGRLAEAREMILRAIGRYDKAPASARGRLLYSKFAMDWVSGDLEEAHRSAELGLDFGRDHDNQDVSENALGLYAAALYQLGSLEAADKALTGFTTGNSFANSFAHRRAIICHALVAYAKGEETQALQLLDDKTNALIAVGNTEFVPTLQALRALLLSRNGRQATVLDWARNFEVAPVLDAEMIFSPGLAQAEVLIRQSDPESLQSAEHILRQHLAFFEQHSRVVYVIEARVLLAMLEMKRSGEDQAKIHLQHAIKLSHPGRIVRAYVDRGSELVQLLSQLDLDSDGLRYAGEIQAAFGSTQAEPADPSGKSSQKPAGMIEVLTRRELQILSLIAEHKSNREIADQLYIAAGTVRRHTENIYQKLAVHKRMDAVCKARGLGILPE